MSKLLYIKANPKPSSLSRTCRIADRFIEVYRETHPRDEVIFLDLYKEQIGFLTEEIVAKHGTFKPDRNHPVLKYAYQFKECDKFVFAEPLWNMGVPAILKAYIDYISAPGITFQYTARGPVGLCTGKKAVNITTRGGDYSKEPLASLEMADRYLKTILGFLGITDYKTIQANNLDVVGQDVEAILGDAIKQAEDLAKDF